MTDPSGDEDVRTEATALFGATQPRPSGALRRRVRSRITLARKREGMKKKAVLLGIGGATLLAAGFMLTVLGS